MTRTTENEDRVETIITSNSFRRGEIGTYSLGAIPQQVWDRPYQARIEILEESYYYKVSSELPGSIMLGNFWIRIRGRALAIYAGINGERQENGDYRYSQEMLNGIKGEITLPEQAYLRPVNIRFNGSVLLLIFSKETEEFLERRAFASRNRMSTPN